MRIVVGAAAAATLALTTLTLAPAAQAVQSGGAYDWTAVNVDTTQGFRALDAVDAETAWVGGDRGGMFRTTDGGDTWDEVSPPGSDGLLFRDVEARSAREAVVLSIGEGEASRIYKTIDGGATWTETFRSAEPTAFYNCVDFWPGGERGIAMSDPVGGEWRIITTSDGGDTWEIADTQGLEAPGEFGYSASGTCLVTAGAHDAWIGGGGAAAKIYATHDGGRSWSSADSTIATGEAAGVFGLGFRNPRQGIAVGGDFGLEDDGVDRAAYSTDGGRTWKNSSDLGGYREAVDWIGGRTAIAVGPNGSDISHDNGRSWKPFGATQTRFHTVDCVGDTCWAAGAGGRVGVLSR
ncbi:WD40/YVTN/BNR-like repeat-containing protein [Nocardioides luteus]|uniref:WD40/YVTN/BNR-like repeat-containing protein n=1 Tax=Nocardioides luteus TaxID=1844 RepID=UPI0018CA9F6D|nr:oxidoreductase [Nocardioides luteus]MBG6097947.1 photosystem II stability/assembly factor-like uncharacterized protein [Nocardioides luteus]